MIWVSDAFRIFDEHNNAGKVLFILENVRKIKNCAGRSGNRASKTKNV